jgi:hypothetical protein
VPEALRCEEGLMLKIGDETMAGKNVSNLIVFEQQHAKFFSVCDSLRGLKGKIRWC